MRPEARDPGRHRQVQDGAGLVFHRRGFAARAGSENMLIKEDVKQITVPSIVTALLISVANVIKNLNVEASMHNKIRLNQ